MPQSVHLCRYISRLMVMGEVVLEGKFVHCDVSMACVWECDVRAIQGNIMNL